MDTVLHPLSHTSQLKTIVTLFIILRVTILFLYTPQGLLNAYTDYQHYYRTAQLSDQGYQPFINMWYEYPPFFTYVSQGVYRLTRAILPAGGLDSFTYQFYARLLGCVLLVFEAGVLILIHQIAARTWGLAKADWLGWVYSSLSLPLFFWNASQNSVVAFFALLAIYWLMKERWARSAVALGLGIATKFTPFFLLAPAIKLLLPNLRKSIGYAAITGLVVGLIFAPFFLLGGGPWIVASFVMLSKIASWSTPWALIDGNWSPGDAGPLSTRLQLDLATHLPGNPPVVPWIVTIAIFAIVYWLIFRRPIDRRDPKHVIWFSTLTAMIFLLWSKGWSPQWATLIIPLWLLSFPDRRGLTLTLLLTALVFIEWPLSDALQSRVLLAGSIIGRALLFIGVAVMTFRQLWPSPSIRAPTSAID
jgi:hypothetical protein